MKQKALVSLLKLVQRALISLIYRVATDLHMPSGLTCIRVKTILYSPPKTRIHDAGALTRKTSSEQIANTDSSHTDGSLKLEHAQPLAEIETLAHGPFDVVVTDVAQTSVLHALIQVPS